MESAFDLAQDSTPQDVLDAVTRLCRHGDDDDRCTAFDLAEGLHWHCADWHGGQFSERYRIMCELDYRPGAGEYSPDGDDSEGREAARYVYDLLSQQAEAGL